MKEQSVKITAPEGLHARPASKVASSANKFKSEIFLLHNGNKINAKSIMHLLAGGIVNGTTLTIQCEGIDEAEALEGLVGCFETIGG